jgi:dolichol-phosphate mannosyltransferase
MLQETVDTENHSKDHLKTNKEEITRNIHSISIIVPTRNESANVFPLLTRIEKAITGVDFEVIFVDDSTDNTPQVIQKASESFSFPIRLLARPVERHNGLGMAVIEGLQVAKNDWVVVLDGDLQHPPEVISQLLDQCQTTGSDLVAGSRLAKGGSTAGLGWPRTIVSRVLASLSRAVFPGKLRAISDPLTGFFLVRRAAIDTSQLQPKGFKILLEILVRNPQLRISEVPFEFGERNAGHSKANSREVIRLFHQMVELRLMSQGRLARFLVVGLSGLFVNTLLLHLFTEIAGIYYLLSAALATQGSTLWNFAWTEQWVFQGRKDPKKFWQRIVGFFIMNNGMLVLRGPFLALFVSVLGMHYLTANIVTLLLMTMVRFAIADRLIWGTGKKATEQKIYYYNIHNIIRIRSMQRLPELGYFRTEEILDHPDINIRIDHNMESYERENSITYDEILGPYGFSIVINQSETQTEVIASPLIGLSPHVLYTNVIEALLRWMFVRKGYALMHGACIAFDGKAMFITAQTDTGKTTTILHTIRNNVETGKFLSDDMTIVCRDGQVFNYPKPLTISQHTLRAVHASPLKLKERLFLQVQSRLHSREGRRAAMWLSATTMPAATLNAIVQKLIPPPKYMVDRLIPHAQYAKQAKLAQVVVIERGPDGERQLNEKDKLEILVANSEDAYGFPPYPSLAHILSRWNNLDLHIEEQAIVRSAISELPAINLRSSTFDWYKRLPKLMNVALNIGENDASTPSGLSIPAVN